MTFDIPTFMLTAAPSLFLIMRQAGRQALAGRQAGQYSCNLHRKTVHNTFFYLFRLLSFPWKHRAPVWCRPCGHSDLSDLSDLSDTAANRYSACSHLISPTLRLCAAAFQYLYPTTPHSLFPIPHSPFPIPNSLFPIPHSLFPTPYSLFPIPYSLT